MAQHQDAAGLRAIVSNHINSIADAFCSLGGEKAPDFVLGLTTLDEAFAFSSRSSSRQWVAFLRQHKLLSSEGAPPFKIFEHNLARPSDVFQLTSITPAAAAGILQCACGGNCRDAAATDFGAACSRALSRPGPNADAENQSPFISLAQFSAALCAVAVRCVRAVSEFGVASPCSHEAALLALLQHLQIVDNVYAFCRRRLRRELTPPRRSEHSILCDIPMEASLTFQERFLSKHGVDGNDVSTGAVAQAFTLMTAGSAAILTLPLLRAFCQSRAALSPLVQGEVLLRMFNCADCKSAGFLSEGDLCLACSGRFKWRRYASLWRAVLCEAVRVRNHGVPSSVMPPVFEPTPKLLARDVFEGPNMLQNSRGKSLSKRLCQRTLSPAARAGDATFCIIARCLLLLHGSNRRPAAVPSDPASSVLFLGRPSSRSSSMSWSRPSATAGAAVIAVFVNAFSQSAAGGKLSFTIDESERKREGSHFAASGTRPASRASSTRDSRDSDSARSAASRQSARYGIMHARLAPPPSPFTLQGHLLQQQLAFHPESACGARIGQYCSVVSEGRGRGCALPPLRLQPADDAS